MKWQQLIVHEDDAAAERAAEALTTALGKKACVSEARNFASATRELDKSDIQWSLVVVSASAPESPFTKGQGDGTPACMFVRKLKKEHPDLAVIAIAVKEYPQLEGLLLAYSESAALIRFDLDWREQLIARARELEQNAIRAMDSVLEVDITLDENNTCFWQLECKRPIQFRKQDIMMLDRSKLRALRSEEMKTPGKGPSFLGWMDDVSVKVSDYLFRGTEQQTTFWQEFVDMRAKVGGTEHTRIRITAMAPDTRDVMLEALKDAPGNDFWMLQAPVVRQYNQAGETTRLFGDDSSRRDPIKCLVIHADPAGGDISDGVWNAEPLPELEQGLDEANSVVKILGGIREAGGGVAKVESLHLDRGDPDIVETLYKRLAEEEPWHLVHFIGHGVVSQAGAAGLVLASMPGAVLSFGALAAKLKGTQFLFVSSCKSGSTAFLTHATRSLIPAALGYRWPVEDAPARRFAEHFYRALFARSQRSFKSLEYAFLSARQASYNEAPEDVTWASPLLLTQLQ